MRFLANCPVCGDSKHVVWPGMLAPFISDRLGLSGTIPCRVMECEGCGLRYSDLRLDCAEVNSLYEGYRGEGYFRLRHAHEPWYTRRVNRGLGSDPEEIQVRQDYLANFLRAGGLWGSIRSVLDFGGDRGQFIPADLDGEKWVYDISAVGAEPGVRTCSRLEELGRDRFDLVMLCHVLEHAMDPMALLGTNVALIGEGGALYVEVPLERPRIDGVRSSPVSGSGFFAMVLDFVSTTMRVMLGWLPPGALLKVSEHVNFFDERSLRIAMEKAGLRVLLLETKSSIRPFGRMGTLHCLAAKLPSSGVV